MAKHHGNGKPSKLKGVPNKKLSRGELNEIAMASAEYSVRRRREQAPTRYRGSEDEMEHRLGMRLPRR